MFDGDDGWKPFLLGIAIGCVIYLLARHFLAPKKSAPAPAASSSRRAKPATDPRTVFYTAEEVAKHNKREDVWLIMDGKVYDVTSFVDEHRGGDSILKRAGLDNTEGFHGLQHPEHVGNIAAEYWIGMLKK